MEFSVRSLQTCTISAQWSVTEAEFDHWLDDVSAHFSNGSAGQLISGGLPKT
jgi:hypothetical protein